MVATICRYWSEYFSHWVFYHHVGMFKERNKQLKIVFVASRKLEIEGTPSAIFFIKTPRYDCCSVSPT